MINYRYDILNKRYNKNHIDDWGEEEGDYLRIENHITERYLWERRNDHEYGTGKEWYRVRGGKYTYKSLDDALEISRAFCSRPNRIKGSYVCNSPELRILQKEDIVDRPLCNHGYPAEVNIKKDKTNIYFTCPIPNWGDFDDLERDEPCKFWKEYEEVQTFNKRPRRFKGGKRSKKRTLSRERRRTNLKTSKWNTSKLKRKPRNKNK
jgi:hypothetical protein